MRWAEPHWLRLAPFAGTCADFSNEVIDRKNPIYPAVERAAHVSGSVQVRFHIGSDGRVSDVTVVSGNAVLAKAAIDAVQGWRYKPATLNGTPIETEGSAVLAFTP